MASVSPIIPSVSGFNGVKRRHKSNSRSPQKKKSFSTDSGLAKTLKRKQLPLPIAPEFEVKQEPSAQNKDMPRVSVRRADANREAVVSSEALCSAERKADLKLAEMVANLVNAQSHLIPDRPKQPDGWMVRPR